MKSYYQDDYATVYHGDCREILPSLTGAAVVTDPPYNVGKEYGDHNDKMTPGEYEDWARSVFHACSHIRNQFWVAPRYQMALWLSLFPESHLVVIRRGASGPFRGGWSDQFETALATGKPNRCIPDLWDDVRLKGEGYFFREETFDHPGYTPSGIMRRAIDVFSLPGETIVDPFCGTGTCLREAKNLQRKSVGCELTERWCEIAAQRLSQEVLAFA